MQTSEDYMKIRRGFLAVYERDFKSNHTQNSTATTEGNVSAHEGDVVAGKSLGLGVGERSSLFVFHSSFPEQGNKAKERLTPAFDILTREWGEL